MAGDKDKNDLKEEILRRVGRIRRRIGESDMSESQKRDARKLLEDIDDATLSFRSTNNARAAKISKNLIDPIFKKLANLGLPTR
ncbi:hypothetical protein [Mangrovactinospora gilvigrisea]|uniref:hypothetical protein n=1 Tax=Mangrovactinospora gilvigrisea TaxID=1428644 RepID=UPI001114AF1F|nr:hypothetical protein [Mangrovactinospora gilvigrisea]